MQPLIKNTGVGLRTPHIPHILKTQPEIPWFELLADNWLSAGGLDQYYLEAITSRYPVVLHGVNLSLGSIDSIDIQYLKQIQALKQKTRAAWYSEHCSFSSFGKQHSKDLLPLPYTDEAVKHISRRIRQVQDTLGERILIENVSSYVECQYNHLSEAEFMIAILNEADCYLLLDINNVYINSVNHGFNARQYLFNLPPTRIKQLHLAGYEDKTGFLLDTHSTAISQQVWQLFSDFIKHTGARPTLIEWDNNLPDWPTLNQQRLAAEAIINSTATRSLSI